MPQQKQQKQDLERVKVAKVGDGTWSITYRGKIIHDFPTEAAALHYVASDLLDQVAFAYYLLERSQADAAQLARAVDHAAKQLGLTSREELLALAKKRR